MGKLGYVGYARYVGWDKWSYVLMFKRNII
jgi:hypothetical protein